MLQVMTYVDLFFLIMSFILFLTCSYLLVRGREEDIARQERGKGPHRERERERCKEKEQGREREWGRKREREL